MTQKTSRPYKNNTAYCSRNFKIYADVSVLRDLALDSGTNQGTYGLRVFGAGTLVLRPVNGPADGSKDVTLPTVAANTFLELEVAALVSGTATNILAMW